jgi:hypothetical protein
VARGREHFVEAIEFGAAAFGQRQQGCEFTLALWIELWL